MTLLSDHPRHVTLTDDQFDRLVELLTPGYECSKLMLAELQKRAPQPDTTPEDHEQTQTPLPPKPDWKVPEAAAEVKPHEDTGKHREEPAPEEFQDF